jgi:X-Pro dipeptidyl-peptidase
MSPLAGTDRPLAVDTAIRRGRGGLAVLVALVAASRPAPRSRAGLRDGQAARVLDGAGDLIRQELWVETTIDSDFDGVLDRIHIDVTRVQETDTIGLPCRS